MDLGLAGKTALITGGSKGIGFATARQFAAEGCNVILVARTESDLDAARARIAASSKVTVQTVTLDLSSSINVQTLANGYPDVDILVNNAGAIPRGRIDEIDEERWRAAWDLKVFGYINLTRAYFDRMSKRCSGVIVNIIGTGGERPTANYIVGAAGNASLMAFTRALGGASPQFGVRVVGINPGATETGRLVTMLRKQAQDQFGDPERWGELRETMPLGRPAKPEEIGAMAAFLASDLSASTSGTVITIDRGFCNHPH